MNATRRKAISEAMTLIGQAKDVLENVRGEEQECIDNTPENLQGRESYTKSEEAVTSLDEAINSLEEVEGTLEGAVS